MNRKFIVPFETAKKLKDAGCDCVTNFYYRSDGNFENPSQSVSPLWLSRWTRIQGRGATQWTALMPETSPISMQPHGLQEQCL